MSTFFAVFLSSSLYFFFTPALKLVFWLSCQSSSVGFYLTLDNVTMKADLLSALIHSFPSCSSFSISIFFSHSPPFSPPLLFFPSHPSKGSPPITLGASDSCTRDRECGGSSAGGRHIAVKGPRVDSYRKGQLTPLI